MVPSLQFGAFQHVTMSKPFWTIRQTRKVEGYLKPFKKADYEKFNKQVEYQMKRLQDYAGDSKHPVIAVRLAHLFPLRMNALVVSGEKDINQLLAELRERQKNLQETNKRPEQGDSYVNSAELAERPVAQVYNWAQGLGIPDLESCLEQADREVLRHHIKMARIYGNSFEMTA
ncbi:MAG TPA: hypothetical protein V6C52_09810 [Coleofasciculaceae cyanobacterium]